MTICTLRFLAAVFTLESKVIPLSYNPEMERDCTASVRSCYWDNLSHDRYSCQGQEDCLREQQRSFNEQRIKSLLQKALGLDQIGLERAVRHSSRDFDEKETMPSLRGPRNLDPARLFVPRQRYYRHAKEKEGSCSKTQGSQTPKTPENRHRASENKFQTRREKSRQRPTSHKTQTVRIAFT